MSIPSICALHSHIHILHAATLRIVQGRLAPLLEMFEIVGIATVELDGDPADRPTYYFDCITNLNNGSGIRWTRVGDQNTFEIEEIPNGSPGKRLNAEDIASTDLGVYVCSDLYSDDVAMFTITSREYNYSSYYYVDSSHCMCAEE